MTSLSRTLMELVDSSSAAGLPPLDATQLLGEALDRAGSAVALIDCNLMVLLATKAFCHRVGFVGLREASSVAELLGQNTRFAGTTTARLLRWLSTEMEMDAPGPHVFHLPTTDGAAEILRLQPLGTALWLAELRHPTIGVADLPPERGPVDRATLLSGRRRLVEVAEQMLLADPNGPLTLIKLDVERLRAINDRYGEEAGDEVLRQMALRLVAVSRTNDLVLRVSGDRFALLLRDMPSAEELAAHIANIADQLRRPYLVVGRAVQLLVNIGVAQTPFDCTNVDSLVRNSVLALDHAKHSGVGTCFFNAAMARAASDRETMELDLVQALALDQFELHYQPQVNLADRAFVGVEALLRWRRPGHGLVSPVLFIPVAEQLGLIEGIGAWVLQRACLDAASHPTLRRMCVNVSPMQVKGGGLLRTVQSALRESGLDPTRLELEITEGTLLEADENTRALFDAVRARGTTVALDDFGTGYASLSQLTNFRFDRIKVDRSFMHAEAVGMTIMRAAAMLGRELNMATLAEGVETEHELARAREAGCTEGQGYLFGRPVPLPQLLASLAVPPRD